MFWLGHTLLHSYLRVPDIAKLAVTGFNNLTYRDKLRGNEEFLESDEEKRVSAETDRMYLAPSNSVTLYTLTESTSASDSDQQSVTKTPFLEVSKSASLLDTRGVTAEMPCDVVFWNPWIEKSRTLADLDDDAYLSFVCVEPGTVKDWVRVAPQHQLTLSQTLSVL